MSAAIVTGSCGLLGSAVTEMLLSKDLIVVGIDNDFRGHAFGKDASTASTRGRLLLQYPQRYFHEEVDIQWTGKISSIVHTSRDDLVLVVHAAGQPSHDWSGDHPVRDFAINALATVQLLEAVRMWAPKAVFIFASTNKVYGDSVNNLGYMETETRWEPCKVGLNRDGIAEKLPLDMSKHSPFGVSKAAADLMVQEYGRYYGLMTACFRCGCITGAAHQGVELHGFLSYLVKCFRTQTPYTIHGYKGKQVRDNIHAEDVARAFWHFYKKPRSGAVYNMGGGYGNSISILEAIDWLNEHRECGPPMRYNLDAYPREGDHRWWVSNTGKFRREYPEWDIQRNLDSIMHELMGA